MKSKLTKKNFHVELLSKEFPKEFSKEFSKEFPKEFSKESKSRSRKSFKEPLQLVRNIIFNNFNLNNDRILKKNYSNDEKQKRKRNFQENPLHATITNFYLFNKKNKNLNKNYLPQYDKNNSNQKMDNIDHLENFSKFYKSDKADKADKSYKSYKSNKSYKSYKSYKFYATSFANSAGSLTNNNNNQNEFFINPNPNSNPNPNPRTRPNPNPNTNKNSNPKPNYSGNLLLTQDDVAKNPAEISGEIAIPKNQTLKIGGNSLKSIKDISGKGSLKTHNRMGNLKINNSQVINFKKNSISIQTSKNKNKDKDKDKIQESLNLLIPKNIKTSSSMKSQDIILGPFSNYKKGSQQNSRFHLLDNHMINNKSQKSSFFHHIKTFNQKTPSNYQTHYPFNYTESLHHNFVASIPQSLKNNFTSIFTPSSSKNKQDVAIKEIHKDQNKTSSLVKDLIKAGQSPTNFKINKELFYSNYSSKEFKSNNLKGSIQSRDVDSKKKEINDVIQIYLANQNKVKSQKSLGLTKSLKSKNNKEESPMILSKEDINKMLKAFTRSASNKLKKSNINTIKSIIINENKNTSGIINFEGQLSPVETVIINPTSSFSFENMNKTNKTKAEDKEAIQEGITNVASSEKITKTQNNSLSPKQKMNSKRISLTKESKGKEIDDCVDYKHTERFLKERDELITYIKSYVIKNKICPPTTLQFYRIGRCLGKGGFGKVYLGIHKLSGKYVAIKTFSKDKLKDTTSYDKIYKEISILKMLKHKSIIRLFETFESEKSIQLVCELCVGGDLLEYVRKRRKLSEECAKYIMKQILKGVYHCHMNNILHRDLKLDNILLNAKGEIKIGDFGVSKIILSDSILYDKSGTLSYLAPEVVNNRGYHGFFSDIWSIGIVLYAMLHGSVPFKTENPEELSNLINEGKIKINSDLTKEATDLINSMLTKKPDKRIKIAEIVRHKWFENVNEIEINIFTQNEIENIKNGLTISYNGESEVSFIEQNIDKTENELTKNISAKSVMLAPYNTVNSEGKDFIDTSLIKENKVIKFAKNVMEIDKGYELNNNGEVDNGVYNCNNYKNCKNCQKGGQENKDEEELSGELLLLNNNKNNKKGNDLSKKSLAKFYIKDMKNEMKNEMKDEIKKNITDNKNKNNNNNNKNKNNHKLVSNFQEFDKFDNKSKMSMLNQIPFLSIEECYKLNIGIL